MQLPQNAVSKRGIHFQKENILFPRVFYPHKQTCSLEILPLASLLCLAFQHLIIEQVSINFRAFPWIICSYFLGLWSFPSRHHKLSCFSTSNCNMPNRDFQTYSYLSLSEYLVWMGFFCPKQKALLKSLWDKKSSLSSSVTVLLGWKKHHQVNGGEWALSLVLPRAPFPARGGLLMHSSSIRLVTCLNKLAFELICQSIYISNIYLINWKN